MEELYDAMVDLKKTVQKQNELQEETNNLMRALADAIRMNSQVIDEMRAEMMDSVQALKR